MSLRSPTEHEISHQHPNAPTRHSCESRNPGFTPSPPPLDTCFRGYDGQESFVRDKASPLFSKERTKDTKGSDIYTLKLRDLRDLRGDMPVHTLVAALPPWDLRGENLWVRVFHPIIAPKGVAAWESMPSAERRFFSAECRPLRDSTARPF